MKAHHGNMHYPMNTNVHQPDGYAFDMDDYGEDISPDDMIHYPTENQDTDDDTL